MNWLQKCNFSWYLFWSKFYLSLLITFYNHLIFTKILNVISNSNLWWNIPWTSPQILCFDASFASLSILFNIIVSLSSRLKFLTCCKHFSWYHLDFELLNMNSCSCFFTIFFLFFCIFCHFHRVYWRDILLLDLLRSIYFLNSKWNKLLIDSLFLCIVLQSFSDRSKPISCELLAQQ